MADTPIGALLIRVGADIGGLIDGFDKADRAVGKFTDKVDKRLIQPLAKVTAAAAAAGVALVSLTKNAADTVDQIGKMSQKVGVAVEGLSGLAYAAKLNNVELEGLGAGLRNLSKFMVENKITGVGVEEQLLRIADSFAEAADDETKTTMAMKYFGKAGADLIPMLNEGRRGIEELRKEASRLGLVFSDESAKKAAEFNDNLTRLEQSVKGLQIQIAGPLVQALNEAAKAMLDAQRNGDSMFQTLITGWRTLVTGNDAHKWNVELTKLVSKLHDLKNERDALAQSGEGLTGSGEFDTGGRALHEIDAAIAELEAKIKAHKAIKDIVAPEKSGAEGGGAAGPKKKLAIDGMDDAAIDEVVAAGKEAMKREQEIFEIKHKVREEEDNRELEQIAKQNEEKAKLREEGVRQDLENQQFMLDESDRIRREDFLAQKAKAADEKALNAERVRGAQGFLGNMASLMNTSSRKTFEFGKVAAMAEGGVKATLATLEAYEWGTKLGGPWLGAAFATAAAAAGLNMLNNIRQQTFGGGGGSPTPVGQGASGVGAAPQQQQSSRGPDTVIRLQGGEVFSRRQVRDLGRQLEEDSRDGGRIFFVEE